MQYCRYDLVNLTKFSTMFAKQRRCLCGGTLAGWERQRPAGIDKCVLEFIACIATRNETSFNLIEQLPQAIELIQRLARAEFVNVEFGQRLQHSGAGLIVLISSSSVASSRTDGTE